MKKMKKNIFKKQKGITIIALVITIVVLLILAGITIGAITGNNGIIGQTQTAKTNTEREQIREQIDVMVVQSIGRNGNVDKEVLMPKLETLPDGKEIYDTDEEIYIVYPDYTFKVDLSSGDVSTEDVEVSKDDSPWELAGSGTEEDPYLIESIEDLVAFSNDVNEGNIYYNKYVKLTKTLDFKLPFSYVNPKTKVSENETRIIKEDTNGEEILTFLTKDDGTGFNPIGDFSGTFDGNGKEIKNIYINRPNEDHVGLFGKITSGQVSNTGVEGTIIGEMKTGGICGYANNLSIEHCYMRGKINSNGSDIGGIAGDITDSSIKHCFNLSEVTYQTSRGGGIVGDTSNSSIENCYNVGSIRGHGSNGGIIGNNSSSSVENCYNLGDVIEISDGSNNSGGICGTLRGKIVNIYNKGKIEGTYQVGAIVGQIYKLTNGFQGSIKNAFFENGTCNIGVGANPSHITGLECEEIVASEMPSVISVLMTDNEQVEWNGQMVDVWKEDTNNINNGYPILFWQ